MFLVCALLYLLYIPLTLNSKGRKIFAIIITIVIWIGINLATFQIITSFSFDNDNKIINGIYDPIMEEFYKKRVFESSRLEYLISNAIIVNEAMIKFNKDKNESNLLFAKDNITSIINLKEDYKVLLAQLKYKTNKKVIEIALEYIEQLEKLEVQLERIKNSSSYFVSLETIKENIRTSESDTIEQRVQKLDEKIDQLTNTVDKLNKGMTIVNSSMAEINNITKALISINKRLNNAIIEKTNWVKFKNKFWFLP